MPPLQAKSLYEMSLLELTQLQFTSSREYTSVKEAPSSVTVITAEDIQRYGYKNLLEALTRGAAGFYHYEHIPTPNIMNRGFRIAGSARNHYLILIDGHSQNNIASVGNVEDIFFPLQDNVKRIEVIRGPGSTMWGSDAAMAIINIITYNASDIDTVHDQKGKLRLSYDYELDHERNIGNFLYANSTDAYDLVLSGLFTNSRAGQVIVGDDSSPYFNMSRHWDFEDSYNLYMKFSTHDFEFKGRLSSFTNQEPDFSTRKNVLDATEKSKQWLSLTHAKNLSKDWKWQGRLYYNDYTDDTLVDSPREPTAPRQPDEFIQKGFGAEAIVFYEDDDHSIKFGLFADRMFLEQVVAVHHASSAVRNPFFHDYDQSRALFAEHRYYGLEKFIFTYGARLEDNKLRDNSTNFLPRFSTIYLFNEEVTLKYNFNTGYVRPTAYQSLFNQTILVDDRYWFSHVKSETVDNHEVQLLHFGERSETGITLFHQRVHDAIVQRNLVAGTYNGRDLILLFASGADIIMKGIEIEAKYQLQPRLSVYGNYMYSNAKGSTDRIVLPNGFEFNPLGRISEDLNVIKSPDHIWNLGLNFDMTNHLFLNIHYRGFSSILTDRVTDTDYHYVDTALFMKEVLGYKNLDGQLYVRNLLDNDHPNPNIGVRTSDTTRQIGFKLSYLFD